MDETTIAFPKHKPSNGETFRETGVALSGTQRPTRPGLAYERASGSGALAVVPIDIDKLYPATIGSLSDLATALGLLAEAIRLIGEARASMQKKEFVASDRYVQRFQANLPALFTPRKIGDGYAVIVNSLHVAFINQRGRPLNIDQLTTVWRVLRELRNAPFIQFEQALGFVNEIEKCGLQVDPPIVSELLEESEDDIEHEQGLH